MPPGTVRDGTSYFCYIATIESVAAIVKVTRAYQANFDLSSKDSNGLDLRKRAIEISESGTERISDDVYINPTLEIILSTEKVSQKIPLLAETNARIQISPRDEKESSNEYTQFAFSPYLGIFVIRENKKHWNEKCGFALEILD